MANKDKTTDEIQMISLSELKPYEDAPFKVRDDDNMKELVQSIMCHPNKNGHKIALKNGMNRNNSFTFVEVVAFIPRFACGRPLPIRLKGERTKQPHGQFASAQAYHIGSSLSSDVSTINNKPLLVLYWRQPIKSRLGAHGIVIRFDI